MMKVMKTIVMMIIMVTVMMVITKVRSLTIESDRPDVSQ